MWGAAASVYDVCGFRLESSPRHLSNVSIPSWHCHPLELLPLINRQLISWEHGHLFLRFPAYRYHTVKAHAYIAEEYIYSYCHPFVTRTKLFP